MPLLVIVTEVTRLVGPPSTDTKLTFAVPVAWMPPPPGAEMVTVGI